MNICTIIAKNYVAQARTLAESFTEHHPDGRCFTLILDDFERSDIDPDNEPFTVVRPSDLDLAQADFDDMRSRYNVLEFSTAVKPWLLRYMLDEHDDGSGICYFDPDIRVYSRMEELEAALQESNIVLTPHLTKPMPRDGMKPGETDIMIAGIYNLGFMGLSAGKDSDELVGWWKVRLRADCWVAVERGLFVDQKWIDWVPGIWTSLTILRVPTYNVAYWNVPTRDLARTGDGGVTVDGLPLRFFHFSGYSPDRPTSLSKHQDRVQLLPGSVLTELCDGYGERMLANRFEETRGLVYDHDILPSGHKLDHFARELYRQGIEDELIAGSIFSRAGEADLVAFMNQADPTVPGLTRYLHEIWNQRPDLQLVYPDIAGGDLAGYLGWCDLYGRDQVPIADRMLDGALRTTSPPAESAPAPAPEGAPPAAAPTSVVDTGAESVLPFGVNVAGYLRSELGIGEVARQMTNAMDAVGLPNLPRVLVAPNSRQGHAFITGGERDFPYPINLIFVNADGLPGFVEETPAEFFKDRYSIGYWWWELAEFPDVYHPSFDLVDEIWVGSRFVADSIGAHSDKPVITMPVPIDLAIPPALAPGELGWPTDAFTFHFSWDYNSVFRRKNPLATVEAYKQAFAPGDGAALVLKCINGDRDAGNHALLVEAIADRPDIVLIDEYVAARDKNRLIATCDCYVSLHRSEGLGLTMAEAMLMGKPVIATNYSGNTDFMTAGNSYPVDYTLAEVGAGAFPYDEHGQWAEPDVDHAARLMREVFDDQDAARATGQRAAQHIRDNYSPTAVGRAIDRRLARIRHQTARTRAAVIDAPEIHVDGLGQLVQRGTLPRSPSRFGKPGAAARKLLLRGLKPYSAYQGDVNDGVLRRVDEVREATVTLAAQNRARILDVESAQTQDLASVLAELRRQRNTIDSLTEAISNQTLERHRTEGIRDQQVTALNERAQDVARVVHELGATPYMASDALSTFEDPQAGKVFGFHDKPAQAPTGDEYLEFEELFRGSEDFIRERQRRYLPIVEGHGPVLDLGCGRGEFLDLMAEAGIEAIGIDSDVGMVNRCKAKGHESTILGDALQYLEGVEDHSLGVIFSAQVVEHIPPDTLRALIELAPKKLKPGGLFIAETVNPHAVSALKTFWMDITHQHPLFPEAMVSFCRIAGFSSAYAFHPNGTGDFDADRTTTGEYAVVATA